MPTELSFSLFCVFYSWWCQPGLAKRPINKVLPLKMFPSLLALLFILKIRLGANSNIVNFMIVLLTSNNVTIGLVNVYMPYDDRSIEMLNDSSHILGELLASISELPTCDIICLGDLNADPSRSRVWNILKEFCDENQFRICDLILPPDTFAYLSPSHNSTSWLDHVLCSGDVTVTDIKVLNNLSIIWSLSYHCENRLKNWRNFNSWK